MSKEKMQSYDDATLWALVEDIATVMEQRNYKPRKDDNAYMFWYDIYKELESELDRRLLQDYTEG